LKTKYLALLAISVLLSTIPTALAEPFHRLDLLIIFDIAKTQQALDIWNDLKTKHQNKLAVIKSLPHEISNSVTADGGFREVSASVVFSSLTDNSAFLLRCFTIQLICKCY